MNQKHNIYMDVAASTMPSDKVIQTMKDVVNIYANPSSIHNLGLLAKEVIDVAKTNISDCLGCTTDELYFTSGATMGNQIAIQGWLRANKGILIVSRIEHNDIIELCEYLVYKKMCKVKWLDVDKLGYINHNQLENLLKKYYKRAPILVICQMANGETGTIQDMIKISEIVHKYNATLLSDVTQAIADFNIDLAKDYHIDMITMSGQKIHCIKGTGLLYVKDNVKIDPIIFGEQGLIGGTENVIGIACLGTAFTELYSCTRSSIYLKREALIDGLSQYGELVGDKYRLDNNIAMIFKGISGENMVELLSEHGIYVSSGSACSSHNDKPSHVLKAMGYSDKDAASCVRFTIDDRITYEDIDYVVRIVSSILETIKSN